MEQAKSKLKKIIHNKEVENAGWIIAGRIVQMAIALVVSVYTARFLGPDNYGLINYGATYVAFFISLSTLGINSIIVKEFVDYPEEQGKTMGTSIVLQLLASSISILMIFVIVNIVDANEMLTIKVVFICSVSLLFYAFESIKYWFQYKYKAKISSIAMLIAYLVVSLYRVILLILGKDVRWFAFASSIDYMVVAIFLYVVYKKNGGAILSFSWKKGKNILKKSYHYIFSGMMVATYAQTDKLMLKQMINETEVGYYSVATAICSMWVFILQAIIDSVNPTIMRLHLKNEEQYKKKNRQLYAIVYYVSMLVSVGILIFGDIIIKILYGVAYVPAIVPLKIITWYTAFSYLGVARNSWIVCEGKQKYLKYMYLGAAIINIGINYLLIPRWGASGAAMASLITQMCTSIVLPMFFKELRPNAKLMLEAILLKNVF